MSFITTYTKRYFDPLNVDESLLDIKDIAHALSLICREMDMFNIFIP